MLFFFVVRPGLTKFTLKQGDGKARACTVNLFTIVIFAMVYQGYNDIKRDDTPHNDTQQNDT